MMRVLLFLCLWQTAVAFAAPIKVEVDRQTVSVNESFKITFSTTEDPDANPDFSPLEKNFDVIDRNHGSNSTWVNGVSSTLIQWTFDVMAKRAGNVTIPAVRFGSETSPALSILVTEGNKPDDAASNGAELFLEVEAAPTQVFVQSQVLYTVRFFRRVNIAEASLKEPEVADAVVTKLDDDKNYKRQVNGVEYAITERHYAIFPQKSGTLTIAPLVLTAAVLEDEQSGFGGFFGARATRTERVSSKAVTLAVSPAPAAFKGHWLVAQELALTQQWSGDVRTMKVGEPLTRTLTLTAKGTTVGQLPQLHQATSSDDLKNYPDQPKLQEQKSLQGIVAAREEKVAFIPAKAGTYTLPAVQIPWFNLQTQQMENAEIPAVTVIATGVAKVAAPTKVAPVDKSVENPVDKPAVINAPTLVAIHWLAESKHLWQGLAAFFALGWLATALFLLRKKPDLEQQRAKLIQQAAEMDDKNNVVTLRKACGNNNAVAAQKALLVWGKEKYNAATLGAIAGFCDARLRDEILNLNQILYGRHPQKWEGKHLFKAFSEHRAMEKSRPKQDDKLEPLHRL